MQFSIYAQFNNYQAIVVSDVLRTFVVFSYICGDIQWSALGINKAAVVGFNAVSCTFNLGKRRKRQTTLDVINNMVMQVPTGNETVETVQKCRDAFKRDKKLLEEAQLNVTVLAQMLVNDSYPCPCTRRQAIMDRGRFRKQDDITQDCYVSTNPVEFTLIVTEGTLTQQCCYDNSG